MKKLIGVFLFFLFALCVGCSSDADNGKKEGSNSNSREDTVEVTFWRHEHDPEEKAMKRLIKSFEEEHPNIKVKMEIKTDYETALRTALAGGNAPDIMQIDSPTLASYANNGALLPLDAFYERDGGKEDITDAVVESLTYNGKMYAAPLNDASLAMFYNKKLFEEKGVELPPTDVNEAWTWEEVLNAAKKLNDPDQNVYGWVPTMGISSNEGQVFSAMPWIWQAGGDILSEDNSTASGYLDSDESKKALDFYRSLFHEEEVAPQEIPEDGFANGRLAIDVVGPWHISYLQSEYPDFVFGEDWDIAPLWRGKEQVTPMGSWNMAISSQSDYPEEAWLFVDWVTGEEGSKIWYEHTGNLPARHSTYEAIDSLNEHPMNIFVEQAKNYAKPRPVTPHYPVVSKAVGDLFEDLAINNTDVDEAVEKAVQEIDESLK